MSYYHEARQAKVRLTVPSACIRAVVLHGHLRLYDDRQADLKTASLDNKRKAERRAELVTTQVSLRY